MKVSWLALAARYDALQLRERWLVAAAVLGGIFLIGYSVFVDPAMKRAQLAERSELEQRVQLANMQQQMAVLLSPSQDPDVAARIELDRLKKDVYKRQA